MNRSGFKNHRKKILIKTILCLLILISIFNAELSYCQNADKKPLSENPTQFRQYVVDETNTLTASQLSELNSKLRNEDKTSSNQIIVYIIPSLDGESLEDVSIRLAEKNKIGKKDRNNGVLMLIVKDDRKLRIEVGYGLEGVLTDARSSSIIRNEITPAFKSGNYYEGINKGVDAIIATIKGEYTADKTSSDDNSIGCCFGVPIFIIVIFGFIFFIILSSFLKSIFGAGRNVYAGKKGWNNSGWWGGGGFGGGSSSGSSGGFGGGGFSGGGGSFGGGGASGSW